MAALPVISGATCIAALAKLGYRVARQKGSHVRLACGGRPPVTVPLHSELDRGTMRSILRTIEISVDEFIALLDWTDERYCGEIDGIETLAISWPDTGCVMVVLRPTRKLHSVLPLQTNADAVSDTALGDWYVNRLVVDRRPLLLLVSANALLPALIPARDVRTLPAQLASIVGGRLRRASIDPALVAREVEQMAPVVVAPTCDRSVLGIMVDFAKAVPFYLVPGEWDETTLPFVESRLAETPCFAGRAREATVFPYKTALERLRTRWGAR